LNKDYKTYRFFLQPTLTTFNKQKANKRRDDVERGEHGSFRPWLQHLYLFSI